MKQAINIDTTAHDRMMARFGGYIGRGRPLRATSEDVSDFALDGYAMLYERAACAFE
jgi:hypothetical protein